MKKTHIIQLGTRNNTAVEDMSLGNLHQHKCLVLFILLHQPRGRLTPHGEGEKVARNWPGVKAVIRDPLFGFPIMGSGDGPFLF